MAKENKTQPSIKSVTDFLQSIPTQSLREDSLALDALLRKVTQQEPTMWGSIIGYGTLTYIHPSGRQGSSFELGFAARSAGLSIYLSMDGAQDNFSPLLERLGKHKMGSGCLSIRRLEDSNPQTLEELLHLALSQNRAKNQGA
jgi:hypothetical protein